MAGGFGLFFFIMIAGAILYFLLKGKSDRPKAVGAPKRAMSTAPIKSIIFKCPYPRCPVCAGAADKMRQDWDGLRVITWTCGYCGNKSDQELSDGELPLSARRRLGLEQASKAPQTGVDIPATGGGYGIDAPPE